MQRKRRHSRRKSSSWAQGIAALGAVLTSAAGGSALAAPTETVLYTFTGGSDGGAPNAGVISDWWGNLYGTAALGGASGNGVVFKLAPPATAGATWTETVLHSFTGGSDGGDPLACLLADWWGNLYSTTYAGGVGAAPGNGVVFKLSPPANAGGTWTETVLHSFSGGSDGANPSAGLIADTSGNLYSTAYNGGSGAAPGNGVVFKLGGTETVLFTFTGGSDGANPASGLLMRSADDDDDGVGKLYGTTFNGGASGLGVVFKLKPDRTEKVLHSFTGGSDGANPNGGVITVSSGDNDAPALYGTASAGGSVATTACAGVGGCGVVYKLSPNGTETPLYTFTGGSDGAAPLGDLIADCRGNLYGTASAGGKLSGATCTLFPPGGCGVVFKITPDGTETVLHTFTGTGGDGAVPASGLLADPSGNLYGTTSGGGTGAAPGNGVVFKITGTGFATECSQ